MESHIVKIISIEPITHDVLGIVVKKPAGYLFTPGQATEVAINRQGWQGERRPFTFTSLPDEENLAFTIKTYPSHKGVTNELLSLAPGDELILHDVWGAISYKGPGVFIAGGAGITPFLAIFRYLKSVNKAKGNQLLFANKTKADIICEKELSYLLGYGLTNILSDETRPGYEQGMITVAFLKEHVTRFDQFFYVCGPPPMMKAVQDSLMRLGAGDKSVVVEI